MPHNLEAMANTRNDDNDSYEQNIAELRAIPKRLRPQTPGQFRPMVMANHLKKLYEVTLIDVHGRSTSRSTSKCGPWGEGGRRGRQPIETMYVLHKAMADSRATGQTLPISEVRSTKAFDAANLEKARFVAADYVGECRRALDSGARERTPTTSDTGNDDEATQSKRSRTSSRFYELP